MAIIKSLLLFLLFTESENISVNAIKTVPNNEMIQLNEISEMELGRYFNA